MALAYFYVSMCYVFRTALVEKLNFSIIWKASDVILMWTAIVLETTVIVIVCYSYMVKIVISDAFLGSYDKKKVVFQRNPKSAKL